MKCKHMRAEDAAAVRDFLKGENLRESCAGCIYRRGIGSRGDRYKVCHYCIDTGMPRGCPAAKCTRKKVAR